MSNKKATDRRGFSKARSRGQSATLEIVLAATVATASIGTFLSVSNANTKASTAIAAGDQLKLMSKAAAGYIQANYLGFMNALAGGNLCGGTLTGTVLSFPLAGALPNVQGAAGGCQTIYAAGLMPDVTTLKNPYQQDYLLLVAQTTPAGGVPQLKAVLATVGGQAVSDNIGGIVARRVGPAAGLMASATYQPTFGTKLNGVKSNFQLDPAAWAGAMAPGHPAVYLNYFLNNNIDQSLQRYASSVDSAPNRMAGTLYMAGQDSSTGGPVNLALNGAGLAAGAAGAAGALAGGGQQPVNSVLGARQLDGQILTGGSSVSTPFANNAAQGGIEHAGGQTINDTASANLAGHTVLANANLDIAAGYRMTAADGIHVTANNTTIVADAAGTAQNPSPNGAFPTIHNGTGFDVIPVGQAGVPGLQWDQAHNSGLMMYYSTALTKFFISTYAGAGTGPVGFEADGGVKAPIYYDSASASYYVQPGSDSNLRHNLTVGNNVIVGGYLSVGGNAYVAGYQSVGTNTYVGCNTYVGSGYAPSPQYSACGNVDAWDVHSAGGLYSDRGATTQGNIISNYGNMIAANGYLKTSLVVANGSGCWQGNGAMAVSSSDGSPTWCQNGIWKSVSSDQSFYTIHYRAGVAYPPGAGGANPSIANWKTGGLYCPGGQVTRQIYTFTAGGDNHYDVLYVCSNS